MADFSLRITLTAADGAQGRQIYAGPDSARMAWDREPSTETTGAVIELIDAHGEVVVERDLDGDEWRAFEEGDGLAKVHRWMKCSKFYGGLRDCLLAAQMGTDPDGWTDAHEELVEQQEREAVELVALRDKFAGLAMQAVPMQQGHLHDRESVYDRIAAHAYRMADAMLRARKGGTHA